MIRSSFFEKGVVSGGCFGKKLHRIDPSDQPLIYITTVAGIPSC